MDLMSPLCQKCHQWVRWRVTDSHRQHSSTEDPPLYTQRKRECAEELTNYKTGPKMTTKSLGRKLLSELSHNKK